MQAAYIETPHLIGAPATILQQALEGLAAALSDNGRELFSATLQVEQRDGRYALVGRVVDSCGDVWAHSFGFETEK